MTGAQEMFGGCLTVQHLMGSVPMLAPEAAPLSEEEEHALMRDIDACRKDDCLRSIPASRLHQALRCGQTRLRAMAADALGDCGGDDSVPFLIDAMFDDSFHLGAEYPEAGMATTRYWANESLKKLTQEDFKFVWNLPEDMRQRAVDRWRAWYLEQREKGILTSRGAFICFEQFYQKDLQNNLEPSLLIPFSRWPSIERLNCLECMGRLRRAGAVPNLFRGSLTALYRQGDCWLLSFGGLLESGIGAVVDAQTGNVLAVWTIPEG